MHTVAFDSPQPPRDSNFLLEPGPSGLTLSIPPRGLDEKLALYLIPLGQTLGVAMLVTALTMSRPIDGEPEIVYVVTAVGTTLGFITTRFLQARRMIGFSLAPQVQERVFETISRFVKEQQIPLTLCKKF